MINGLTFPSSVNDERSLKEWIASIDRPVKFSTQPLYKGLPHIEKYYSSYFSEEVFGSESWAKSLVCRDLAMALFYDLIKVPNGTIVWRVSPEFDISYDTVPADLTKVLSRKDFCVKFGGDPNDSVQVVKRAEEVDWTLDFSTDLMYPVAAKIGVWKLFKTYARYQIVVEDQERVEMAINRNISRSR